MIKTFEEYIEEGIVIKQSPDYSRARALSIEAEEAYETLNEFLEKIGITVKNANNVIKNTYDIIMELIRSKMFTQGYNSSEKGAHEAEVSYLGKIGCSTTEIDFADKLRWFRNGILYYGKKYDKQYAEKTVHFLKKIYSKLK